jgi:TrpR-related protein YerC/YecD
MAYESRLQDPMVDDLFQAVLLLRDQEDCYRFFEDLCTVGEIKALSQRWRVVKMLTENRTYADIIHETGVSTATISRVKKCLHYGADGYQIILERTRQNAVK